MALGMGLLYGSGGGCFLMSEVPLYPLDSDRDQSSLTMENEEPAVSSRARWGKNLLPRSSKPSAHRWNNSKSVNDFYLNAKARIWP